MAVIGKITNVGLTKSIEAQASEGWKIYPTSFGVSDVQGELSVNRTTANTMWYQASISSRVVLAPNSIVFICTVPPSVTPVNKEVKEVYIFAKDQLNNDFLLALGQPNTTIIYDKSGSLTFRLIITLANVQIGDLYEFHYTQATEISEHDNDPNAHPDLQDAIAKAGIFVHDTEHEYRGQFWDEFAVLDASVADKKLVYKKASDSKYYPAIADSSEKQIVVGISDTSRDKDYVIHSGLVQTSLTTDPGVELYLSVSSAGDFTTDVTPVKVGVSMGDGVVLLGTVGGGAGGGGDISGEDILYEILLAHSSFEDCYYDTLKNVGTVNLSGSPLPTFDSVEGKYDGENGSILISPELLPDTDTRYKFFVHLEKETSFTTTLEYSINDGVDWYSCNAEEVKVIDTGYTSLKIRITWMATGSILSFGVLFGEGAGSFVSDTKMLEVVTVSEDHAAPYDVSLPYNNRYSDDRKSLEVYLNRARLIIDVDYEEKNNREVTFLTNLYFGDTIVFIEKWGYVDNSIDNAARLAVEHDSTGYHVITDQITGQNYQLVIQNGSLNLIPV